MRTWFRRCSTFAGLALIALALTATTAAAQRKADVGFLGGASFSTLMGVDDSVSVRSSTGFAGPMRVVALAASMCSFSRQMVPGDRDVSEPIVSDFSLH